MSNGVLFYVCGIALAVSAVLVSFAGLRARSFPGRAAPLVALWFIVLVGASTTFAVLHARDEKEAKAAELAKAGEEVEKEQGATTQGGGEAGGGAGEAGGGKPSSQAEAGGGGGPKSTAQGPGGTLQLAASPTQIAFDKTQLSGKPGKVTIELSNPSTLEHDVAIERGSEQIAVSDVIAKGKTSVSVDLEPGTYTFLCTVPGHAEAGMEGTLTVK